MRTLIQTVAAFGVVWLLALLTACSTPGPTIVEIPVDRETGREYCKDGVCVACRLYPIQNNRGDTVKVLEICR
jgi:hypothetical protein